jgi:predicted aminopeptidase
MQYYVGSGKIRNWVSNPPTIKNLQVLGQDADVTGVVAYSTVWI